MVFPFVLFSTESLFFERRAQVKLLGIGLNYNFSDLAFSSLFFYHLNLYMTQNRATRDDDITREAITEKKKGNGRVMNGTLFRIKIVAIRNKHL